MIADIYLYEVGGPDILMSDPTVPYNVVVEPPVVVIKGWGGGELERHKPYFDPDMDDMEVLMLIDAWLAAANP